jgi:nucleoside-diphosphate-sugar epimerase
MRVETQRADKRLLDVTAESVLVTGGSGFLGSHLCRRLLNEGLEVHAVSRNQYISEPGGIRWWQADVTEISSVRNLFQGVKPGIIFHLSGLATARPDRDLVLPTLHSLLVSTVNVLTVAAEIRCRRIVLAASLTEPQANGFEIIPGSPYAAAKWASGGYARMFHELYKTPVVMVRPFMTYGPGQDEGKLVPHVILSLLKREAPKLSSGQQQFDWIYVDDVMDGFIAAVQAENIEGRTIDLGSGRLVSVRTVVDRIAELIGAEVTPAFGALADRPLEWARVADTQDAFMRMGWKPHTSLEEGLQETVRWHRNRLQQTAA